MTGTIVFMLINLSIIEDLQIKFTILPKNAKTSTQKVEQGALKTANFLIQHSSVYIILVNIKLTHANIFQLKRKTAKKESCVLSFIMILSKDIFRTAKKCSFSKD
jgi:hypothetical protein